MKILFYSYPWAFQRKGGGEIQLLKTKEYLKKKGVFVKLFNQWEDKFEDYDIFHVFGSVKDTLGVIKAAKSAGLKICVSSIFWTDIRRFIGEVGIKNKVSSLLHHIVKSIFPFFPSGRREIFKEADIILPNSHSEAHQIQRYFWIKKNKFFVVPNGVEERFLSSEKKEFVEKYKLEDFILYVGRIEPRKNQLNFIRAMKDFKAYPIVFVGPPTLEHQEYYKQCLKERSSNMFFLGYIDHNSSLFSSMYAASKVFCLTSWFETPGLSALEAGLAGNNIVITPYGSTKDYFKDYVAYARPYHLREIREKVEKALSLKRNYSLSSYIRKNFLWSHVADRTLEAYQNLLS